MKELELTQDVLSNRTHTFISPSGHSFTVREQNGEDEDILSNPKDSRNLMNLTKFICAIVVDTDFTETHRLNVQEALSLPILDRYAILFHSRIFSMGSDISFGFKWDNDKEEVLYEDDLSNFIFNDYSQVPTQEELDSKLNAIPYYPNGKQVKDICITLSTDKIVYFDLLSGIGEQFILNLPEDKQTRNAELMARNIKLVVDGKPEKITNFRSFSVREMAEIRKHISAIDPTWYGHTELENPKTGEKINYPIMAAKSFFYLTEA